MPYLERKTCPLPCKKIKKTQLLEKAHNAIIISLGDMVLREVAKAKSTAELWLKLESLYMTKLVAKRLQMLWMFLLITSTLEPSHFHWVPPHGFL